MGSAEAQRQDGSVASDAPAPRIERRVLADGRVVWIKRFGTERLRLAQRLHGWLARTLPIGFWSASPRAGAGEMRSRELRKYAAFRRAGIAVPEIVEADAHSLTIGDAGPSVEVLVKRLAQARDTAGQDELLVRVAASLGAIHGAGLCHGRPHLRDVAAPGEEIVWFDFEEEPEATMPVADAQARDVWLLFFQICWRAGDRQTPVRALHAYREKAPSGVVERLAVHLSRIAWTLPVARLARRVHAGGDLVRYVGATAFLLANLVSPDMPKPPEPPTHSVTRFDR
ncbi:serine/threonine protein phosphatase [Aureimonas sp. ME7]|uniref:serine/threonine protein phosphatase n=1 Tax=Aureimonas sp. ME7 TaxID=2744252 RepID=UPI0015F60714|nr:serine/threonine protein phosphatase [Aureimonas sp. ME7]